MITNPFEFVKYFQFFFIRVAVNGRIIRKSGIVTYSNGTGKFFTFDFADLSGEIRCKAFNDIANMFFEQIIVGNVVYVNNIFLILSMSF